MEVIVSGATTDVSEVQPLKAASPMRVTELGMITEVMELHASNALALMEVIVLGM
jgi:hypothetical protein